MNLLEFLAERIGDEERNRVFIRECNEIFEEEKVGYRFVHDRITSIVTEQEIETIEEALDAGDLFFGMREHLKRSVELFSDRQHPDYRNSIKEAISAVESVCRVISGKKKATLGDAIKVVEQEHGMHPALKEALLKLYGYSSDKGGIRHSLLDDPNIGVAEAKFMLVGCSAFCNYMIEQYGQNSDASGTLSSST